MHLSGAGKFFARGADGVACELEERFGIRVARCSTSRTRLRGRFSATTLRANAIAPRRADRRRSISSSSAVPASCVAGTLAPETIMLSAASTPIARGSRCVPPAPGRRPSLTSGSAICASRAATRKWQPSASSRPPPMQTPPIAAITGLSLASTMRITVCSVGSALAFGVLNSRMSAPPENSRARADDHDGVARRIGRCPVDAVHDGGARRVAEAVDRRVVQRDHGDAVVGSITSADGFTAPCSDLQPFLAHRVVGAQLLGDAFEHDAAVAHHIDAAGRSPARS